MGKYLGGLLGNDTIFGRIMTKLWIMIAANLLFVVFSLPVVTAGPAWVALHYVMLKSRYTDESLNPITTFWQGFRRNIKQGMIAWIVLLLFASFLYADIRFCKAQGGILGWFLYGLYAILFLVVVLSIYLAPVMAAFSDSLVHLLRNALFFASRRPVKMLLVTALHLLPAALTYLHAAYRPLYGFLWVTVLAGAIGMGTAHLLIGDFARYLPPRP